MPSGGRYCPSAVSRVSKEFRRDSARRARLNGGHARVELDESLAQRLKLLEPLGDVPQDCRYPNHVAVVAADW